MGKYSFYETSGVEMESEGEKGVMMRSSKIGECDVWRSLFLFFE